MVSVHAVLSAHLGVAVVIPMRQRTGGQNEWKVEPLRER
jgi:hypothetical protein